MERIPSWLFVREHDNCFLPVGKQWVLTFRYGKEHVVISGVLDFAGAKRSRSMAAGALDRQ